MTRRFLFPLLVTLTFGVISAQNCPVTSIEGSVLVLKACENGLAYGLLSEGKRFVTAEGEFEGGKFDIKSSVKSPSFDYKTGFRVALNHQPLCLCGDFYLDWMHYRGRGSDCTESAMQNGKGTYFSGTWSQPVFGFVKLFAVEPTGLGDKSNLEIEAKANLKVELDTVRFGYGYPFCPTSCLVIRPFWGVQLAYIDQLYALKNVYFGGLFRESSTVIGELEEKVKLKNDFFGYGLQAGVQTEYALGCNFSLRSSGAFSLVKGSFDLDQNYRYRSKSFVDSEEELHNFELVQKQDCDQIRAIADMEIGLKWQTYLCQCRYLLTFQIGWESHWYFGQNQWQTFGFSQGLPEPPLGVATYGALNPVTGANRGHLGLSGWSFSASLYF